MAENDTAVENVTVEEEYGTILPWTGLTVSDARSRLSGLHFAKDVLSEAEREILYIAEGLLRLLDEEAPEGFRR